MSKYRSDHHGIKQWGADVTNAVTALGDAINASQDIDFLQSLNVSQAEIARLTTELETAHGRLIDEKNKATTAISSNASQIYDLTFERDKYQRLFDEQKKIGDAEQQRFETTIAGMRAKLAEKSVADPSNAAAVLPGSLGESVKNIIKSVANRFADDWEKIREACGVTSALEEGEDLVSATVNAARSIRQQLNVALQELAFSRSENDGHKARIETLSKWTTAGKENESLRQQISALCVQRDELAIKGGHYHKFRSEVRSALGLVRHPNITDGEVVDFVLRHTNAITTAGMHTSGNADAGAKILELESLLATAGRRIERYETGSSIPEVARLRGFMKEIKAIVAPTNDQTGAQLGAEMPDRAVIETVRKAYTAPVWWARKLQSKADKSRSALREFRALIACHAGMPASLHQDDRAINLRVRELQRISQSTMAIANNAEAAKVHDIANMTKVVKMSLLMESPQGHQTTVEFK